MRRMNATMRRTGLVLLAVLMVLSIIPLSSVTAATTIEIKNLYTSASQPNQNNQSVTRVSTKQINIEVETNGIAANQVENLEIVVENVVTGFTPDINIRPVVSDNGYDVTFYNVDLTEGLNRVVVKMAGINGMESVPGWVYYVPSVRIDQLTVTDNDDNELVFNENTIYPLNTLRSTDRRLEIAGRVYNADRLTVKALDDSEPTALSTFGNSFGFLAGPEGTNSDIFLQGGDNILIFAAENNTYHTTVEKNVIYDDGEPFVYDVRFDGSQEKLIKNPEITTSGSVTIVGKMKLDNVRNEANLIVPEYRVEDVSVEVLGVENNAVVTSFTVNEDVYVRHDEYNIYEFELEADVAFADRYTVKFTFERDDAQRTKVSQSNLMFTYNNPNRAYINYVAIKSGSADTTGTRISEFVTNEVTEQPMAFFIYANTNTQSVQVRLEQSDGTVLTRTSSTGGTTNPRKFTVEFDGVTSGLAKLEVIPVDSQAHSFGKKSYDLHISSTPYIVSNNLHNGLVIESMDQIRCGTGHCFSGRFVNVPSDSDMYDVNVYLNNALITNSLTINNDMSFRLNIAEGTQSNSLLEGVNQLEFVINLKQTGSPATRISYTIYKFTQLAPEILEINIDDDPSYPLFTEGSLPNTYFTNEELVRFEGLLANVDEVKLTVRRTNDDGERETYFDHWHRVSSSGNDYFERVDDDYHDLFDYVDIEDEGGQSFETEEIRLTPVGETVFEFEATNNDTKLKVFRTITITREAVPYKILYPSTFRNVEGLPQANINSNYVEVFVQAEYADQVIYEKQPARKVDPRDYSFLDRDLKDVFVFEVSDLRGGRAEEIEFTVMRGQEELDGALVLFNANQPEVGASFQTELKNRLRVFDDLVELQFERNTSFKRYGTDIDNPFLSSERKIVFGLANRENGKVDLNGDRASISERQAAREISRRSDKFIAAGPLIWIDAGEIRSNTSLEEAYTGSGKLPYEYPFDTRDYEDIVVPNKRGTLTLKYDESIVNEGWRYLTVFHYGFYENRNGDVQFGWQNIGGVVDTKKKTITVSVDQFGYFQVMYMKQSFSDVLAHDWAKNDIETLFSKGYMLARPNAELFSPYEPISRGEFTTMLVKIFDIPLNYEGPKTFRDTENLRSDGLWEEKYIETAARAGLSRGVGQIGYFSPNDPLTREQAAVMIARAANLKLNTNEQKVLQSLQKSFTDANSINLYAQPAIEAVAKAGLITGKEHSVVGNEKPTYYFDPLATLRRDEAAAIAIRVLQNQKKIPK